MGKQLASTLAAITLAGALAACDSHAATPPMPTSPHPTTATPSPTAPATPSVPTMPEVAQTPTEAGATAFVIYYWQVVDYASTTLDTALLEELTGGACDACRRGIAGLKNDAKRGITLRGGSSSIHHPHVTMISNNGVRVAEVEFTLKTKAQVETFQSGKTKTYPAGTVRDRMWLQWLAGHWAASQLEVVK